MKVEYFANILVISVLLIAAACASKAPVQPVEEKPIAVKSEPEPKPKPLAEVVVETKEVADVAPPVKLEPPTMLEVRFDYDSAVLTTQARQVIKQNAEFLINNPQQAVLVVGHADERGSDQYNFQLGLQRAKVVREALLDIGVQASQLKTESFGEKQPKLTGKGEKVWRENRRAAFSYGISSQLLTQPKAAKRPGSDMFVSDQ